MNAIISSVCKYRDTITNVKRMKLAQFRSRILLLVLLLVATAACAFFWQSIFTFFKAHYDIIGWVLGIVVSSVTALYHQNRWVYLWIQRNVILPFKVTHSEWNYCAFFETTEESDFDSLKLLLQEQYKDDYKISSNAGNQFSIFVKERVRLTLELSENSQQGCYTLSLTSSSFLIPSYMYEETIRYLHHFFFV